MFCSRAAIYAVVERLTQIVFNAVSKSMQERDRYIYTLLLALEVGVVTRNR